MLQINLSEYASSILQQLQIHLSTDPSSIVEEAVIKLYQSYVVSGDLQEHKPESMASVLDKSGFLKNVYRCYRVAFDKDQRQEEIIEAYNEEDAWQQMAKLFPSEVTQGFEVIKIEKINFDNL
ncbi:MAG: hypothetical protein ACO31I_14110 [Prochlorotrichaceae cyanobacterium]|jgi:hypothetical protein